ncbi:MULTISPECIES: response regulator [Anaeromyxobacter]|uniref:response regulator n=1 Tax=Anaeromyxobacter TaxID=161492 RepID=UPI001F5847FB|nr:MULTISPECIES: response regulator [unclassified Anaeromyxobacter]
MSAARPLRRVLVVDDERDIRTVARIALEAVGGFEVAECASGTDAIARLDELRPDLILLDVMMPGTDGPATLAALRACAGTQAPVVVFLTARVQPGEVAAYGAMGAAGVVTKPFDPLALAAEVLAIWERAAPPRALPEKPAEPAAPPPRPAAARVDVASLRAGFVSSLDAVAQELEAKVAAGEADAAGRLAHRLRGTAGTFGLPALSEAAAALEDALLAGRELGSLAAEVARLRERLLGPC